MLACIYMYIDMCVCVYVSFFPCLSVPREIDWVCVCYAHNFKNRTTCYKCGKNQGEDQQVQVPPPHQIQERPGDWFCSACEAHNFATRDVCYKCHKDKSPEDRVCVKEEDAAVPEDGGDALQTSMLNTASALGRLVED